MGAHKGIREFEPQELGGMALGQNGFHIIGNASSIQTKDAASDFGIKYWVAMKAVRSDSIVEARTYSAGTDFALDGVYSGFVGSNGVTITNGDIVYGCFDKIQVAAGDYIIAYIGR